MNKKVQERFIIFLAVSQTRIGLFFLGFTTMSAVYGLYEAAGLASLSLLARCGLCLLSLFLLAACCLCWHFTCYFRWYREKPTLKIARWFDLNLSSILTETGEMFGCRFEADGSDYYLLLKLERPRSYAFPGCDRVPHDTRMVAMKFINSELDVLWAFRDFRWQRFA